MKSALIGYSGFVGQTLLRSTTFDDLYRSTNIASIEDQEYDLVVSAGAPAKKWIANQDPIGDAKAIDNLIQHLSKVKAKTFVLISTVDVFKSPVAVNETTPIDIEELHPYGFNRWRLEEFVKNHFQKHLIIRLPGLVGAGLKKNIIFDFLNNNQIERIESRNVFQFYPMIHLWDDIQIALKHNLSLLHLTAEPIDVCTVGTLIFEEGFRNHLNRPLVKYDMQSVYAHYWGGERYQYSQSQCKEAITQYFKSEPRTL